MPDMPMVISTSPLPREGAQHGSNSGTSRAIYGAVLSLRLGIATASTRCLTRALFFNFNSANRATNEKCANKKFTRPRRKVLLRGPSDVLQFDRTTVFCAVCKGERRSLTSHMVTKCVCHHGFVKCDWTMNERQSRSEILPASGTRVTRLSPPAIQSCVHGL